MHSIVPDEKRGALVNSDHAKGKLKETEGKAQQAWGDVKEKADDLGDAASEKWRDVKDGLDDRDDESSNREHAERA
jgi:uncharacterized protein YjbJ (UPF0337 family)